MTRDEATQGLADACHHLIGLAVGMSMRDPMPPPTEVWRELRPQRAHIDKCCRALGLRTLATPYGLDDEPHIKCLKCGLTSYHPKDIEERFCGKCHAWHDQNAEPLTFELSEKVAT